MILSKHQKVVEICDSCLLRIYYTNKISYENNKTFYKATVRRKMIDICSRACFEYILNNQCTSIHHLKRKMIEIKLIEEGWKKE